LFSKAIRRYEGVIGFDLIRSVELGSLRLNLLRSHSMNEDVAMTFPLFVPIYNVQFHSVANSIPVHKLWELIVLICLQIKREILIKGHFNDNLIKL